MRGFLAVDKPGGLTSHDVVDRIRRVTGVRKVGHAGTLDPMATGLLVVAVGPVTRLLRYAQGAPKEYVADVRFGIATDSLDADGTEVERSPMPLSAADVEAVLPRFRGEIQQVPPMVSAIKQGGVRLHVLARRGEEVPREPRTVTIHRLDLLGLRDGDHPVATLRVGCSTGTYVRVLGDDIARALGGRAHLSALRRTRIGALDVGDAVALDRLEADGVAPHLLDPAVALGHLESTTVDASGADDVVHGRPIPGGGADGPVAIVDDGGRLLAVYRSDGSRLRPETVLPR